MIEEASQMTIHSKFLLENPGLQLKNLKIRKIGTDIEDLSFTSPSNRNLSTRSGLSKSCQKGRNVGKKLFLAEENDKNRLENDKKFIETLEEVENNSSELRQLNKTPSFSRNKSQELQELKEMFDRLKIEQEKLKSQLSFQKNLIKMIGTNLQSSGIDAKSGDSETKVQKPGNKFGVSGLMKCKTPNKIRTAHLHGENFNISQNHAKILDDSFTLPALSSIHSDRKINPNKFTFLKYSRDLPVLTKNLKFPKDVFVVKK